MATCAIAGQAAQGRVVASKPEPDDRLCSRHSSRAVSADSAQINTVASRYHTRPRRNPRNICPCSDYSGGYSGNSTTHHHCQARPIHQACCHQTCYFLYTARFRYSCTARAQTPYRSSAARLAARFPQLYRAGENPVAAGGEGELMAICTKKSRPKGMSSLGRLFF